MLFIKNAVNLGAVKNWHNASAKATGDVVFLTEQGDLMYGPETIERISNEIEKQRLDGLKDPYVWLAHFKSFKMKNGTKSNYYFPVSTKNDFDLIENYPKKALEKMIQANFICGSSLIFNSKYFDKDIYPHHESIKNLGDYPCLLWNLINRNRIGTIRQFIHWYEYGVGVSSRPNDKLNKDIYAMFQWLETLYPDIVTEYTNNLWNLTQFCNRFKKVYFYGAGLSAYKCMKVLAGKITQFMGYIVSDGRKEENVSKGKTLYELSEISPREGEGIIVTIISEEVLFELKKHGFTNVICFYKCKNLLQRIVCNPFIPISNALTDITKRIWVKKAEKESSQSFGDGMFSSQYYQDRADGIF